MDRLKAMATFVRIVDAGSMSAAAELAGQSNGSVVRTLAALEKHLGVRLLNRNTRNLALTAEGAEFLSWSRRILSEFDEIEDLFESHRDTPQGLLRVTAPVEFGGRFVAPLVHQFMTDYPAIRVELMLLDNVVDLIGERMDVAIRIGRLPDSTLVAVPIGQTRLVVCVSPAYLEKQGAVEHPSELKKRDCISFAPQGKHWDFRHNSATLTETISARLVTNQVREARLACQQGLGFTRLLHYQVARELKNGSLVRVLRDFEPPEIPVQVVYPHCRLLPTRVRYFIDWIAPQLREAIPMLD